MKWLKFFRKRRKGANDEGQENSPDSASEEDQEEEDPSLAIKRRSLHATSLSGKRPSLEQWFEARKARTSIEVNNTTTTDRLTVCKAGVTTLINRTYIVVKHLGSGTYGQVKLAFNLKDKKLYAIKACRKSQLSSAPSSPRSSSFRVKRSLNGMGHCGMHQGLPPKPQLSGSHSTPSALHLSASMPPPQLQRAPAAMAAAAASAALNGQPQPASTIPSHDRTSPNQLMPPPSRPGMQAAHPAGSSSTGSIRSGMAESRLRAEEFVREIAIMKKLSHPNIVRLVEVIDDPGSDNLLLVMEYVEGSSLHPKKIDNSHWEPVQEMEVWQRTRDVLQGLDYLHYHEIVHGDLKPANLMQDSATRQVKIVDFGSAVFNSDRAAGLGPVGMACTPAFRSPESLQAGYKPSYELDMWALGVTVYLWVFGELPFNGSAPFMVYENIRNQELRLPKHTTTSDELANFLRHVLDKNPRTRYDAQTALRDPWVTAQGLSPLSILERAVPMDSEELATSSGDSGTTLSGRCASVSTSTSDSVVQVQVSPKATMCTLAKTQVSGSKRRFDLEYARSVSQEELDLAISQSIGGHAVSELMGLVFEEVKLAPRQQIIKAGDLMSHIYLIAQGEVEIYHDLIPEGIEDAAAQPIISGLHCGMSMEDAEDDEDFLGSHHGATNLLALGFGSGSGFGSNPGRESSNFSAGASAGTSQKLNHSNSQTNITLGNNTLTLATKGPGDSLGLASLGPQQVGPGRPRPTWRAHVRAKGEVIAFRAEVEAIHRLVQLYPELEAAIKHMAVQQETDFMVAEALRQLKLVGAGLHKAGQQHSSGLHPAPIAAL